MIHNGSWQILLLTLMCLTSSYTYAHQEVIDVVGLNSSDTQQSEVSQCSSGEIEKNRKIISYCDSNWKNWEIEKPPVNQRRSENDCSGLFSTTTVTSCGKAILGLPLMAVDAVSYGWETLFPNKNTFGYISQNGSLDEIVSYLVNEKMTEVCGISTEDENYKSYSEQVCNTIYANMSDPYAADMFCNRVLTEEQQRRVDCVTSEEAKKLRQQFRAQVLPEAQNIKKIQEEQKSLIAAQTNEMQRVHGVCKVHLPSSPHHSLATNAGVIPYMLSYSIYLSQEIAPNPRAAALYNDCVHEETKGNQELRAELEKSGRGLVEQLLGHVDALQCYDEATRRELQCEVVLAAGTLGGSLAATTAKKLGRKGLDSLEKRLGRRLLKDGASAFAHLDRVSALSDVQRVAEASRALGRKLNIDEASEIIAAHNVGRNRAGAGYGSYTQSELTEKARILESFSVEDRRILMESGIVGQAARGTDHLGSSTALSGEVRAAMSTWDTKQYPIRCRECNFTEIKVSDVTRGHLALRHEHSQVIESNMRKAMREINILMNSTRNGQRITNQQIEDIFKKNGVPYRSAAPTTLFPRGTDFDEFFKNLDSTALVRLKSTDTGTDSAKFGAVINGDRYVFQICVSHSCSRGQGVAPARRGEVITAHPIRCGSGSRVIPSVNSLSQTVNTLLDEGRRNILYDNLYESLSPCTN